MVVSGEGTESARPRVVVAEDEALIRLDLVELLTAEGYEVVGEASDGAEALKLVRELVDRAREAGAMAYVVKPFDASDVVPAIELAMARFAEIRALDDEVADLEERLASRKAVDQAKGMLQEGLGLSEAEAFRWIQKTAMDLRKSMREVAEGVIEHGKSGKGKAKAKKAAKPAVPDDD